MKISRDLTKRLPVGLRHAAFDSFFKRVYIETPESHAKVDPESKYGLGFPSTKGRVELY